jgi:hypothetical protein
MTALTPAPERLPREPTAAGVLMESPAQLFMPRSLTPSHDATLQEASAAINRILASLNPPPGRKLCLYCSAAGPVLLWAVAGAGQPGAIDPVRGVASNLAENNTRVPRRAIRDPQAIADALGLRQTSGGNRLAKVVTNPDTGFTYFTCPDPGTDCLIHARFTEVTARTPSYDGTLAAATEQINAVLERAASKSPRPDQTVCLFWSPEGPVLIWTYPTAPPGRVAEPGSAEYQKALRDLLGR